MKAVSSLIIILHLTGFGNLSGVNGTIRGLHVLNTHVIWVSGTNGSFSTTRNGGKTWTDGVVKGAEKLDFRDVHAFTPDRALLMSIGPGKSSKVFLTTDGGKTWAMTYENQDSLAFFDGMDFFDDRRGWIISDPTDQKPHILETRDGGITWERLRPSSVPDLIDGEYAFAASGTSLDLLPGGEAFLATGGKVSRLFHTTDYGQTWSVTPLPLLQGDAASGAFSVAAGPGSRVAVCGGHYQKTREAGANIALSADNGKTWSVPSGAKSVPFMECIRWINRKTLVAAGPPGVWISKDGGLTWSELSQEGFHTLDVRPGDREFWVAGNRGAVKKMKY